VGIAREVSVIESGQINFPATQPARVAEPASQFTSVEIVDADLCPRYAARVVRGVKIGPSPEWLAKRLEEIGQRPINNVADITNYVLHELGQPLHAFDLARLSEQRIVVRRGRPDEKLRTLDGVDRELDSEMLVIADANKAVALAGIMGGEESEISVSTVDVLIESAYFDPDSVRKTARKLGMDTEASRRFERGADCENVLRAQSRCVELICEIAGGTATIDAIDVYPSPVQSRTVSLRPARVEGLTSISVSETEMLRILSALGFTKEAKNGNALTFAVPSWRGDVSREEDLVEEVARHTGYNKIGSELPPATMAGEYQPNEIKLRALRRAFSGRGYDEAINFSFIDAGSEERFELIPGLTIRDAADAFVSLKNPIVDEANRMRPTLLPRLLDAVKHNLNHGIRDVRLFEIGRIFAAFGDGELPEERLALGIVATGGALEEGRAQASRELDYFDVKGVIEAAVDAMKLLPLSFEKAIVKHLRLGQAAQVSLNEGTAIGTIGRLSDPVASEYKIRQVVYVAEIDLSTLLGYDERQIHYKPLPRYPSVQRDVTLWLARQFTFNDLLRSIEKARPEDYRGTRLVGTYEGANIPEDKRAITIRVEYRADDRTLRDEEVEERHRALLESITQELGAEQH
jgi:phenylalanyl-tRNA synthetase beta chain